MREPNATLSTDASRLPTNGASNVNGNGATKRASSCPIKGNTTFTGQSEPSSHEILTPPHMIHILRAEADFACCSNSSSNRATQGETCDFFNGSIRHRFNMGQGFDRFRLPPDLHSHVERSNHSARFGPIEDSSVTGIAPRSDRFPACADQYNFGRYDSASIGKSVGRSHPTERRVGVLNEIRCYSPPEATAAMGGIRKM